MRMSQRVTTFEHSGWLGMVALSCAKRKKFSWVSNFPESDEGSASSSLCMPAVYGSSTTRWPCQFEPVAGIHPVAKKRVPTVGARNVQHEIYRALYCFFFGTSPATSHRKGESVSGSHRALPAPQQA